MRRIVFAVKLMSNFKEFRFQIQKLKCLQKTQYLIKLLRFSVRFKQFIKLVKRNYRNDYFRGW